MQVVEFPDVEGPLEFQYDEEWLGVLQATHHLMSLNRQQVPLPGKRSFVFLFGLSPIHKQTSLELAGMQHNIV